MVESKTEEILKSGKLPEEFMLLLKDLNRVTEQLQQNAGQGSRSLHMARKQIIKQIKETYGSEFHLSELKKDKKEKWNELREEMFTNDFENDEQKEEFLRQCFAGERKFPWHLQGQSVGVTNSEAAIACIKAGGIPIIGGSLPGRPEYEKADLKGKGREANIETGADMNEKALLEEIAKVREVHPHAILGVNILHKMGDFDQLVRAVGDQGMVDILYVGAGLPIDLSKTMEKYHPETKEEYHLKTKEEDEDKPPKNNMRYMAIVSSGAAVNVLESKTRGGEGRCRPDAYVYEDGVDDIAAGHNAKERKMKAGRKQPTAADHIADIKKIATGKPIIMAGGVRYQEDIKKAVMPEEFGGLDMNGVGLGTRGLLTKESGVPDKRMKDIHLNPDILVEQWLEFSPTGYPCTGKLSPEFKKVAKRLIKEVIGKCNECIGEDCLMWTKKEAREKYFCIARSLAEELEGGDYGVSFMGKINEMDSLYRDENGEAQVPTMQEMVDFVILNHKRRVTDVLEDRSIVSKLHPFIKPEDIASVA